MRAEDTVAVSFTRASTVLLKEGSRSILTVLAALLTYATILLSLSGSAPAQQMPARTGPLVEIRGTIQQAQILPGQGTPYLVVSQADKPVRVYLGSMRYLIEQNFNPKVGQEISVRGFQVADGLVAATVALPGSDRVLKLRDENGWPQWRGGRHHGRQR
ncbi:MAG TPA: hypothetical protein VKV05_04060 [Terriglobales bacterium]|nr:hypothetical protein [Terriglobales bacterium]